jgi:hypothetical protein
MGGSEMLKNIAIDAVCLVVGGGAVQLLHAQTKPPAYGIAIIDIKDAEGYKKELTGVRERIGASGGKAIAAGGVSGSGEIIVPEGRKAPTASSSTSGPIWTLTRRGGRTWDRKTSKYLANTPRFICTR